MPNTLGRLGSTTQVYETTGESTPSTPLPKEFQSFNQPVSPPGGNEPLPYQYWHDYTKVPYVDRHERTVGMRTVYSRGMSRMPIQRLGADGSPIPWDSAANRNNMGPIRNCHQNDALYQAGYPGFNLGLSFKVQNLQSITSGQRSIDNTPANINVSNNPPLTQRALAGIKRRWGRSA